MMDRSTGLTIQASTGRIVLSDRSFFAVEAWHSSKSLLEHLLAMPAVVCVHIDRRRGTADIRLHPQWSATDEVPKLLKDLALSLRSANVEVEVHECYRLCQKFGLIKLENAIVAGEIRGMRAGQTVLTHPLLQGKNSLSLVVKRMLEWEPQVSEVTILPDANGLMIQHESDLSGDQLLILLERNLAKVAEAVHVDESKRRLLVSAGCVALAIPAEMFLTGMIPFVAAVLVAANLKTLGQGTVELLTLRWRIPALYTVIIATTLISGQVLAAALMQASIAAWYCWSNRRLRQLIEKLLTDAEQDLNLRPALVETTACRRALPDHSASGNSGPARLESTVTHESLPERLMKSLARVGSNRVATERCHDQASRFIPFTFATGVAAIATADITTLAAVLRPDFSTGPSISEQISAVAVMRELLQQGWLVSHPEALARFVAAEQFVLLEFDPTGSQTADGNEGLESENGPLVDSESWQLPDAKITIHVERVIGSRQVCEDYARRVAKSEIGTVFFAPTEIINAVADSSAVWVATDSQEDSLTAPKADFAALSASSSVVNLCDTILCGTLNTRNGWSIVLTCNLASVLGAFVVGLTSLHVVALTNLGTWAAFSATTVYRRSKQLVVSDQDSSAARIATAADSPTINDSNLAMGHLDN